MFLAWREVRRAKGRFVLLAGAVSLLVILLLFFQSVAGALTGAITGAVANQTGEVLVYSERARLNPAASVLPPDTLDAVREVDGVAGAGAVRQTFATVAVADEQADAALIGLDSDQPGVPTDLSAGRFPTAPDEAVSSSSGFEAAYDLGTTVEIIPGGTSLEIVGIADDAAFSASPTFYVPPATWQEAVAARTGGTDGPLPVNYVAVEPADGAAPADLAERITAQVAGVEAVERAEAVDSLPGVGTITQSFSILYGLLYIVVAIVTGVFFLILTVQKRDALVLLRAIGARRRDVVGPVLLQVVLVVGLGVALGIAATVGLLTAAQDTFGAGLPAVTAATSGAVILALGLLAALGAIRRVLQIEPVEATTTGGLE